MFGKKGNNLEKKLKFTISSKELVEEFDKRIISQQKQSDLKGFRKGKAPLDVIKKYYGDQISSKLIMDKMGDIFYKKITDEKIPVVGQPNFIPQSFDISKDIKFEVTYEIYPEFSLKQLKKLSFKKPSSKIENSDLNKAISMIQKRHGKLKEIDELSKEGDFIKIDFDGYLNGEKFDGGEAKDYPLELGSKTMIPGFEDQLVGLKKDDQKEINVTFPDDYQAENLKGKEVMFKIIVKEVSTMELPDINLEFFQLLGMDVKDESEFKVKISEQLESDLKTKIESIIKQRAFNALEEMHPIDIPESMITAEALNLRKSNAQQMGMDPEKLEESQLPLETFKDNALKRVRLGVLINKVIEDNDLKVEKEDLEKEINDRSKSFKDAEQYRNWIFSNQEQLRNIESILLENKVANFLVDISNPDIETISFEELASLG